VLKNKLINLHGSIKNKRRKKTHTNKEQRLNHIALKRKANQVDGFLALSKLFTFHGYCSLHYALFQS